MGHTIRRLAAAGVTALALGAGCGDPAVKQGALGLVSRTIEHLAAACLGALVVGLAVGGESDAYDVAPRGVAIAAAAISFACAFSTVVLAFFIQTTDSDGLLT